VELRASIAGLINTLAARQFGLNLAVCIIKNPFKALGLLEAFQESAGWALLSSFCKDSNLGVSAFE